MSKRTKINFESVNSGNYTIILPEDIAKSRKRISERMEKVIREYKRNEWSSIKKLIND